MRSCSLGVPRYSSRARCHPNRHIRAAVRSPVPAYGFRSVLGNARRPAKYAVTSLWVTFLTFLREQTQSAPFRRRVGVFCDCSAEWVTVAATDLQQTVDAVWRMEAAKIVATLTRAVGDIGLAEDLAQEALIDALTQWPSSGVPRNAGAWLTTVAKRKAIDYWRRQENLDTKYAVMARELETQVDEAWDPDRIDDDVLRLVFISTHPVLSREGQIALTLRVVGGLTTEEIARAFLTSKPTIAARITRAKKTLADANVPFEVPDRSEYPQRLSAVLSVIYLIYNEGYSASFGQRWIRDELCSEALRLGRVLAALVPEEAEVHGLVALMEFQSSRFAARTDPDGKPILLEDQNRTKWDRAQIQRGVAALERAGNALAAQGHRLGPLRAAGRAGRMPRRRPDRGGHRLEPHRRAVRRAAASGALTRG